MSISYEDFTKVDIRIGTIILVELVPGTDRLLKLTVDIGEDQPRQIVSGIREFFPDPQILVGTQCPFLINLEPRVIRGQESQGMILAGGEGATFTLLHTAVKVPPGTAIH